MEAFNMVIFFFDRIINDFEKTGLSKRTLQLYPITMRTRTHAKLVDRAGSSAFFKARRETIEIENHQLLCEFISKTSISG